MDSDSFKVPPPSCESALSALSAPTVLPQRRTTSSPLRRVRKFLRRFRRYVAIPLVVLALLLLRPRLSAGDLFFDTLTDGVGVVIALVGQLVRFWSWGSNAYTAATGGVRIRGPYALLRHPLYVGNLLIATGLLIVFNNPWAYLLCGVPIVTLYWTIVDLEEEHMAQTCGEHYRLYVATGIPRFLPAVRQFPAALRTSMPFRWRLACKKEYESVLGWIAGMLVLRMYERVFWQGASAVRQEVVVLSTLLCVVGLVAMGLYLHKMQSTKS